MGQKSMLTGGTVGTALQAASKHGNVLVVRYLLDQGADPNAPGGLYGNALAAASSSKFSKNIVVVQLLLERGSNVNAPAGRKVNALDWAAGPDNEKLVRLLLEWGAEARAALGPGESDQDLGDAEELVTLLCRR